MNSTTQSNTQESLVLVLGGTGKTGRRVADLLAARDVPVRIGSRTANPSFDWNDESGWDACLAGATAAYITYAPDLAIPGAADAIRSFVRRARQHGLERSSCCQAAAKPRRRPASKS